jgi:ketosteroid isomerase-like protein
MVVIDPFHPKRIEGGEAAVAKWTKFVKAAKIHSWRSFDPKVQIYGDGQFAIVTYYYDGSYEMGGQTIKTGGRDMFALVRENGKWRVVADQFSNYPKAESR